MCRVLRQVMFKKKWLLSKRNIRRHRNLPRFMRLNNKMFQDHRRGIPTCNLLRIRQPSQCSSNRSCYRSLRNSRTPNYLRCINCCIYWRLLCSLWRRRWPLSKFPKNHLRGILAREEYLILTTNHNQGNIASFYEKRDVHVHHSFCRHARKTHRNPIVRVPQRILRL